MASFKGFFLVAKPVLVDNNFRHTVILVMNHSKEGALGFIVNRPLADAELPVPIFAGGPCESPGLIMLHGHPEWTEPAGGEDETSQRQIVPGVYVGDDSCVRRAGKPIPGKAYRYRIFQGFSGWGPGQLEREIAAGAWAVTAATAELLFDVPPDELWMRLRPRSIPEPSLN